MPFQRIISLILILKNKEFIKLEEKFIKVL